MNVVYQKMKEKNKYIDLHTHLEGSIDIGDLISISGKDFNEIEKITKVSNLEGLFNGLRLISQWVHEPNIYRQITRNYLRKQAENGVVYTEFFVSVSSYFYQNGLVEDMLENVKDGVDDCSALFPVRPRVLVDINRGSKWDPTGELVVDSVLSTGNNYVVGFGLGGDERLHRPEEYIQLFSRIKSAGLHVVAHAGENLSIQSVRDYAQKLGVERIGHGVISVRDNGLCEYLKSENIALEVCPKSEMISGAIDVGFNRALRRLYDLGVPFVLGTDDKTFFDTDMDKERGILEDQGFSEDDIRSIILRSVDHCFCDEGEKLILRRIME